MRPIYAEMIKAAATAVGGIVIGKVVDHFTTSKPAPQPEPQPQPMKPKTKWRRR